MSAVVEENVVVENGSTVETPAAKISDVVMGDDAESARKARARRQGKSIDNAFVGLLVLHPK